MAVIRVNKTDNYTVMSNYHLRDKNLTLKAKGLLSVMLSLPPTWDYTIAGLVAISKEKESAITSALKELKSNKYLIVTKLMPNETQSGRIEYVYDIYEQPHEKQIVEKQSIEKQGVENQGVENQGQLNIDKTNKDKLNKKELNTEYKDNPVSLRENEIILYLNEKANTNYRATAKATRSLIHARFDDGFTIDDFKTVIDKKCAEWIGTDFAQYLRPATLFGTKFESYLNAPIRERKTYGRNGIEIKKEINPEEEELLKGIL